jgi:Uma2 family endonuclease
MSTAAQRTGIYTFGDFCALVREDQKADLIEGAIYMASPENLDGNRLFVWLLSLLEFFLDARDLGRVYGTRVAFRLDDRNGPEPDIAFVRKSRLRFAKRGYFGGRPDAAFEIVSPESVERDYDKKRTQYQRARIPEYWIIDPLREKVILLRLGRDGQYREVRSRHGMVQSQVIPGFWLRPEWLWQEPLPKKAAILTIILAE